MRDKLITQLKTLCHGSQEAVQSGTNFSKLDNYLHVDRPIDKEVCSHMDELIQEGGGIILLVGSAGDGKSHMISYLRSKEKYSNFIFYNDATEGCSPQMSAVETLKFALRNYCDKTFDTTLSKTVLAVNIGKLQDLVEDEEFKKNFKQFYAVANKVANSDSFQSEKRIKVVSFAHRQSFELLLADDLEYPVKSDFMSEILRRITQPSADNPFYSAYLETISSPGYHDIHEVIANNYKLLMNEKVRDTIVKLIIEAIVRFKLVLTPREFLDFVYSILVAPNWMKYAKRADFFASQLPSLLFDSNGGKIQQEISKLDPLKYSSIQHDNELSQFYSSFTFKKDFLNLDLIEEDLAAYYTKMLTDLYSASSGQSEKSNKGNIAIMVFRLNYILKYESYCKPYKRFLKDLSGYYANKSSILNSINSLVKRSIPRLYGSYIEESDYVPLNIQGSQYKIFTSLEIPDADIIPLHKFDVQFPFIFDLFFYTKWDFNTEPPIELKIDYPLYEYMYEINHGKLSSYFDGEKNLHFSNFVRKLTKFSNANNVVYIVDAENNKKKLTNKYNQIHLS